MNLNKDYDWARVIGKRDSLLMQSMEDDMSQVILDYLGVENEEDVSKEHVEELLEIRKFLETPFSEGGKGFTLSGSPHFEVLYNSDDFCCFSNPSATHFKNLANKSGFMPTIHVEKSYKHNMNISLVISLLGN